jgi:hypothetical protein
MNGFKTAAHFSRLFKSYWGCSPRDFRRTGGKSAVSRHESKPTSAMLDDDAMLDDPSYEAFEAEHSDSDAVELSA